MELDFTSSDGNPKIVDSKYYKLIFCGFLLLLLNAGYLAGASSSSVFYYANLILHIVLGLALIVPLYTKVRYYIKTDMLHGKTFGETVGRIGYLSMQISFLSGIYLLIAGNVKDESHAFYAHVLTGFFAVMCLISSIRRAAYNVSVENTYWRAGRWGLTIFMISVMIPLFSLMIKSAFVDRSETIMNEGIIPSSLEEATGEGDRSLFYPSPATTKSRGLIDTKFLQESQSCGRVGCHVEIVEQFTDSPHNRSALANVHYRETLSYVQARFGQDAGNYCAACHSPAALFDGSTSRATFDFGEHAVQQSRLSCTSCHAIQSVKSTLGNGAYVIDRSAISGLSTSANPMLNRLHDFLINADPDPHRQFMYRPFLSKQAGGFCSVCHKLTLEKPFVKKQPVPGLIDYDYWAGGAFARQDIKAFGPIKDGRDCMDCHMPRTQGAGPGSSGGRVKDHSFQHPRASLLSFADRAAPRDSLQAETKQLIDVEIFAVRPQSHAAQKDGSDNAPNPYFNQHVSGFASRTLPSNQFAVEADRKASTLVYERAAFEAGESVEVDVLLKTLNIGHAFPAGSPGSAEAWLELKAEDETGTVLYHIGAAQKDEAVDPEAPYFGVQFVDEHDEPVLWAHGIGAEKVSRFHMLLPNSVYLSRHRFRLPAEAGATLRISANLHYRKREFVKTSPASNHAENNGKSKHNVATMPQPLAVTFSAIKTVSSDRIDISEARSVGAWLRNVNRHADSAQAWNDYGIGFLLQNQLDSARLAFQKAVSLQADFAEAHINIARTNLLAGEPELAQQAIEKALDIEADDQKAQFFMALALKAQGQLVEAKSIFNKLRKVILEDRAILNELGHTYFLLESYSAAHRIFRSVTRFAPDDPIAHFFLGHTYRKLKKPEKSAYEEKLYAKYANRLDRYVIAPSLTLEKSYQPWQVLPWMNYDNYAFSQSK